MSLKTVIVWGQSSLRYVDEPDERLTPVAVLLQHSRFPSVQVSSLCLEDSFCVGVAVARKTCEAARRLRRIETCIALYVYVCIQARELVAFVRSSALTFGVIVTFNTMQ